jgi:alkyl hydroperoxide reductase subunit AhpC
MFSIIKFSQMFIGCVSMVSFREKPGASVSFPILADPDRKITSQLNMTDADEKDASGHPRPSRALHVMGPDKTVSIADSENFVLKSWENL